MKTSPNAPALQQGRRALLLAAALLAAGCAQQPTATSGKEPVRLMTSGGFTAAHKLLAPQFTAQTGIPVESAYGSSMGASPSPPEASRCNTSSAPELSRIVTV